MILMMKMRRRRWRRKGRTLKGTVLNVHFLFTMPGAVPGSSGAILASITHSTT